MRFIPDRTFFIVFSLGPLVMGLSYSLLYSFGLIGLLSEGFTWVHWQRLFASADALGSLWYSFWLTLVSLLIVLVLALGISWASVRRPAGRHLRSSLFLPLLFPPLIAAFAWFYLLSPGGMLSRLSVQLGWTQGIEDFPRLVNDAASVGIILTHVFLVFPLFSLLFREQARKARMRELMQSAFSLGATPWQFLRRVHIPLLLRKGRAVIWLYGIFLMGTYEVPLLLGRSSPRPVTVYITEKLTRYNLGDIAVGHAMAVLYTVLILVVVSFFIRRQEVQML
jgi:putative spermidine/putrescine transport system permease protein